jgi:hypothetical protein
VSTLTRPPLGAGSRTCARLTPLLLGAHAHTHERPMTRRGWLKKLEIRERRPEANGGRHLGFICYHNGPAIGTRLIGKSLFGVGCQPPFRPHAPPPACACRRVRRIIAG